MDTEELLALVKSRTPTEEDREKLRQRLKEAGEEFERKEKERTPTEEFMNKQCTI